MKYIILSALVAVLMSCGGSGSVNRPAPVLTPEQAAAANAQTTAPAIPSGAPVAGAVNHYECPQGHEGGATEGTCSNCGQAYVHNQAFHDQSVQQVQQPATPEPAQNAAGVWHYTCPNGHSGGAGSATPCSECGTTLVHNAGYHS